VLEVPGYRIEGVAGRGGWSVVYRAVQLSLERPVALKVIAPELAGDPGFRARFRRECELAASIDHPHVIPVYDAGEAAGMLFVAMRWVDGSDLRALAPLASARAARVVAQIAGALDAAHARGLVHRDVKPGNVLIESRADGEHAYLTDFGLTKEISPDPGLTEAGRWLGTVDFAAPEQIRGQPTDARSDVYSLGCVLGFAVTGLVPFPRPDPGASMHAHLHEPPPRLPPALAALDPVVQRALAKNPAWRYASAGELGRAAVATFDAEAAAPAAEANRTRVIAASIAVVVMALVTLVALLSGDGDGGGGADAQPFGVVALLPQQADGSSGEATIDNYNDDEDDDMTVNAQLQDPPRGRVYELWLFDSVAKADSISLVEGSSDEGFTGGGELPADWRDYRYVDISIEEQDDDGRHSGRSVLRGDLSSVGPSE
jgi:hypothetical protein